MRVAVVGVLLALTLSSCRVSKVDPFLGITVNCTGVSFDTTAAPAARTCLEQAEMEEPVTCLVKIITTKQAKVEEVACAVSMIAQRENSKVEADAPANLKIRNFAIEFLVQERISIWNSYEGE